jgi:hypothetical protein
MRLAQLALPVLVAIGCGSPSTTPPAPDASDGFQTLISTPWQLPASAEQYYCYRVTMQQDVWIKSIKPIAPVGTHHQVLMLVDNPTIADGLTECSSLLTDPAIYASGVGTNELDFPDGIGLHIMPGQQLFLNLHLFNTTDSALMGTSGIEYLPADPSTIVHEAGTVLAGKATGATVPMGLDQSLQFTCTLPANLTMFAVAPHMHLYGTHLNATYNAGSGIAPVTVLDTDYEFDEQYFRMMTAPLVTVDGGEYVVTCTYDNESGSPVPFGESTTEEMCFAMTYLYPPQSEAICSH